MKALMVLLLMVGTGTAAAAGTVRYVDEEIAVLLRGSSEPHAQPLRLLHSGTRVELAEVDAITGYARVRVESSGEAGWLPYRYLTPTPPTREPLSSRVMDVDEASDRLELLEEELIRLRHALANSLRANDELQSRLATREAPVVGHTADELEWTAALAQLRAERDELLAGLEQARIRRGLFWSGAAIFALGLFLGALSMLARRRAKRWRQI
jgi:SH3 domain protein